MHKINTFSLEGMDVDVLFQNGFLGYTFEFEGKPYGNKVKVKSKSVTDIVSATFLLFENALATYKKLNEDKRIREGAEGVGRESDGDTEPE